MSKKGATDKELNCLEERMPNDQYVDLSISQAREEKEEMLLGMHRHTHFDMLHLKKIA
jgi:hypothetical protein